MSAFGGSRDGSENLLVRARERDLSEAERRELQRVLETNATLRVAYEVGRDFDQLSTVKAGDDELIARAAGRALRQRLPGRPLAVQSVRAKGRPLRLAVALAIAAMLVVSSTAAWTGIVRPFLRSRGVEFGESDNSRSHDTPAGHVRASRSRPAGAERTAAPRESAAPLAIDDEPTAAILWDAPQPQGARSGASPQTPPPLAAAARASTGSGSTAAEVFRQANAARRAGDLDGARALYGELQTRFPGSDEAQLSFVSMGKLLLAAGRTEEAEHQFARYLSLGDGELTEEALVGRARSLELLGRSESERQVWERLLREFTSSVYGESARRRLVDLAAEKP
jgi:TolA-binding protein